LTDFSEQGEFLPFLQNAFVDGIDHKIETTRILKSYVMVRTLSFLRSNDLIYAPAIKSYMLGKAPPAFDLLFWNGDGTNLSGVMARQYLPQLCQNNEFADGGFKIFGETLNLSDVDIPLFAVGCETDHIVPWKDSFRGIKQMGSSSKTFILSQSGHVSGIINPPDKKKYGHYTNYNLKKSAADWQSSAQFVKESWWPNWSGCLTEQSGNKRPVGRLGMQGLRHLATHPDHMS
jgi:polyhydroxyalkanoate synthase